MMPIEGNYTAEEKMWEIATERKRNEKEKHEPRKKSNLNNAIKYGARAAERMSWERDLDRSAKNEN